MQGIAILKEQRAGACAGLFLHLAALFVFRGAAPGLSWAFSRFDRQLDEYHVTAIALAAAVCVISIHGGIATVLVIDFTLRH